MLYTIHSATRVNKTHRIVLMKEEERICFLLAPLVVASFMCPVDYVGNREGRGPRYLEGWKCKRRVIIDNVLVLVLSSIVRNLSIRWDGNLL